MKLKHDKTKTSAQLQQEYARISTALGQALFAERQAIRDQESLSDLQDELNEAFKAAYERERAEAIANQQAAENTKAFEDKAGTKTSAEGGVGTQTVVDADSAKQDQTDQSA